MATVTATETARVDAPFEVVLEIIRDFDGHHRHILPPAFSDFRVVQGGVGAGTVMTFTTTLAGRAVPGRSVATEPAPGVVRESVEGRDMVTEFRVVPDGRSSRVAISTWWTPSGLAERLLAPGMLRRIYREELRLLDRYARGLLEARTTGVRAA